MGQKAPEHAERRQQVGAAHDVRYRIGEQRMDSPEHRQREGEIGVAGDPDGEQVNQADVGPMQQEVHPVVAGRVWPIAQHGVIQKIGEGGERAVESGGGGVVPVFLGENQVEVAAGERADTRVLEDRGGVVEDQAGLETIGVRDEGENGERQQPRGVYRFGLP